MTTLQNTALTNMKNHAEQEILKLKEELKNPKIRKITQRKESIKNLEAQIEQCEKLLN